MMIVRPICERDLHSLFDLAKNTGEGLTTLQADEAYLIKRIQLAEHAFQNCTEYGEGSFLFALVDSQTDTVVGISGIESAVGLFDPWYNYRLGSEVHVSRELNLFHKSDVLFLSNDLTGKSEVCSLFLNADYRKHGNGQLLSKSRFLFMAEFPHLFHDEVIAEMRGCSDEEGVSPFWESLGRHFFSMNFNEADFLTGIGNKTIVAELMPKFPIYSSFLSEAAQSVIGEVHQDTRPARAILEKEGFEYRGYVDIFDAGPALQVKREHIQSIKESYVKPVRIVKQPTGEQRSLVASRNQANFRCTILTIDPTLDCIEIDLNTAQCLRVEAGQLVRVVSLDSNTAKGAS
jgi:arginine N-succinyltransferase